MSRRYVKSQAPREHAIASTHQFVVKEKRRNLDTHHEDMYFLHYTSVPEVLSMIPVMLFTTRPDGMWDYINPLFASFFSLSTETQKDLNWIKLVHPDDQMDCLISWKTAIVNVIPFHVEYRFLFANRAYHYLHINMVPQCSKDGVCLRWIGTATPVVKEYQITHDHDLRNPTEQIRDAIENIISVTAHELSAPLTIIMGQAKILQQRMELHPHTDAKDQRAVDMMVEQSLRLSRLLHMLMDATQIDHGQLYMSTSRLDIGAFVWRVVHTLQLSFPQHSLRVNIEPEPMWIVGDEVRLEQVLHNLIQNAVKYSPMGSEVAIQVTADDEYTHIAVQDHGMGIPSDVQTHLFERFFRAHVQHNRAQTGLGLGLYICKGIIDLHQGKIELASAVGDGTLVTVSLPRCAV